MKGVGVVPRELFDKVCELLLDCDCDWVCDEISDYGGEEWECCQENCKYSRPQTQCVERLANVMLKYERGEKR